MATFAGASMRSPFALEVWDESLMCMATLPIGGCLLGCAQ
jgi:hypothetical protein